MTLQEEQAALRADPNFQVLMRNLYSQAKSCATSPFEKEKGYSNFIEIAELDFLIYLKSGERDKLKALIKQ